MIEYVKAVRTTRDDREEAARLLRRFADDCRLKAAERAEPFPEVYAVGADLAEYDAQKAMRNGRLW